MNKINSLIYILVCMSAVCVGCSTISPDDVADDEVESTFDFSTLIDVPVKITSATPCSLVSIYEDSEQKKPIYHLVTDENGDFSGSMTVPAALHGEKIFIREGMRLIPYVLSRSGIELSPSRAGEGEELTAPKLTVDQVVTLRKGISGELPEGRDNRDRLNVNSSNICLRITAETGTQIRFTFLHTGATTMSKIYYYYYKAGEDLTYKQLCDKFMKPKFCLTQPLGGVSGGFIHTDTKVDGKKIMSGDAVQPIIDRSVLLKFYKDDADTEGTYDFPAGYLVGFFLESYLENRVQSNFFTESKYNFNHPGPHDSGEYEKYWKYQSRDKVNSNADAKGDAYHYIHGDKPEEFCSIEGPGHWETNMVQAIRYKSLKEKCILYAFEDIPINENDENKWFVRGSACDFDFNDFIFAITSTPELGTSIKNIIPENVEETIEGTLLFEDLFPVEGDYDMNDLIVEYKLTKNYDPTTKILSAVDYEFLPKSSTADYRNGLYLVWDLKGDASKQLGPYKVFEDHTNLINVKQSGSIDFSGKNMDKDDINWKNFNPYIVPQETGYEIHCYNYPPSKAHKNSELYKGLDSWQQRYAVRDQKVGIRPYQFAINITGFLNFEPVTEGVRIDKEYPDYVKWYRSEGDEGMDWYKHKGTN